MYYPQEREGGRKKATALGMHSVVGGGEFSINMTVSHMAWFAAACPPLRLTTTSPSCQSLRPSSLRRSAR